MWKAGSSIVRFIFGVLVLTSTHSNHASGGEPPSRPRLPFSVPNAAKAVRDGRSFSMEGFLISVIGIMDSRSNEFTKFDRKIENLAGYCSDDQVSIWAVSENGIELMIEPRNNPQWKNWKILHRSSKKISDLQPMMFPKDTVALLYLEDGKLMYGKREGEKKFEAAAVNGDEDYLMLISRRDASRPDKSDPRAERKKVFALSKKGDVTLYELGADGKLKTTPLGGTKISEISVAKNPDHRFEVFGIRENRAVHCFEEKKGTNQYSKWRYFGAFEYKTPSVLAWDHADNGITLMIGDAQARDTITQKVERRGEERIPLAWIHRTSEINGLSIFTDDAPVKEFPAIEK